VSDTDKVKAAADARAVFYLYEGAGHGFSCDQRASFNAAAAALARTRTLDFLAANLRGEAS
jgi:carboxymethylenebutenolidase